MTKKLGFALLVALVITLLPTSALLACSAICGGGECYGGKICFCDGDDKPVCVYDSLHAQATYARAFNTPALTRFAAAAEKMADAMARGDQDGYFIGVLEREDALKSLSIKEHQILTSWDSGDSKPSGGGADEPAHGDLAPYRPLLEGTILSPEIEAARRSKAAQK